MLKFEERLKAETKKIFGDRVKDGACALCGNKLQASEYCDCFQSIKINYYYQKVVKKIDSYSYVVTPEDEKQLQKKLLSECKIPVKYRGIDFDSYITDISEQTKVKDGVFTYYKDGIKNFLTGENLILTGNYGTGKTMLMSILSNIIIVDFSLRVRYINAV
jgi:DNA replication protein DnaC